MNQSEIFANYEINNSKWYSNILKILGGLIPLYLIVIAATVYVPAIRDTVFLALLFADTKSEWSDKEVKDKTTIETATIVNLSDENGNRFQYPEGYFSTEEYAPPELVSMQQNTQDFGSPNFSTTIPQTDMMPTFNPTIGSTPPVYTPPTTPTYKPPAYTPPRTRMPRPPKAKSSNILDGMLPKPTKQLSPELQTPTTTQPTQNSTATANNAKPSKKPTPKTTTTPNNTATAQNTPNPTNNSFVDVTLYKDPLVKYGQKVEQLQREKKVDLTQPFHIIIEGDLSNDGKLLNGKATPISGDATLNTLATELIGVMNDSNILFYLKLLTKDSPKGRRIKFDVSQDDNKLNAIVTTDAESDAKATELSDGMKGLIFGGKILRPAKDGKVEGIILEQLKVASSGKQVFINFDMDKDKVTKLIQDQLAAAAKQQSTQPPTTSKLTGK